MKCADCNYCYMEDTDQFPCCHWEAQCPGDIPPCEYDDEYEEPSYEELI